MTTSTPQNGNKPVSLGVWTRTPGFLSSHSYHFPSGSWLGPWNKKGL